jgi:hypothetical protein
MDKVVTAMDSLAADMSATLSSGKRSMEAQQTLQQELDYDEGSDEGDEAYFSFLSDLHDELDSTDPKSVAERFRERYDSLVASEEGGGEAVHAALRQALESQIADLRVSLHNANRVQYVLHLLASG